MRRRVALLSAGVAALVASGLLRLLNTLRLVSRIRFAVCLGCFSISPARIVFHGFALSAARILDDGPSW
jgi:hypothetical protein